MNTGSKLVMGYVMAISFGAIPLQALSAPTNSSKAISSKNSDYICNKKLTAWELTTNNIDAHAVKQDALGKKAKISLYELCSCPDKSVVIRLKDCKGAELETGIILK